MINMFGIYQKPFYKRLECKFIVLRDNDKQVIVVQNCIMSLSVDPSLNYAIEVRPFKDKVYVSPHYNCNFLLRLFELTLNGSCKTV